MDAAQLKAIEWPKAKIAGVEYTFRLAYPARSQLIAWGFGFGGSYPAIPIAAWAAAMAGAFDKNGKWRSAGFERWMDVTDAVQEAEIEALSTAVNEAIKKASPESIVTVDPGPAKDHPPAAETNGMPN
jgi:hypothetical protein